MDLDQFKNTWQHQDSNNDESIKINQTLLTSINVNKQMVELRNMKWARAVESAIFLLIIVALSQYIVNHLALTAATISAAILNIFAIVGLAGNIGQIALLNRVDYSMPIKTLQKHILDLCSHKLQVTKLLLWSAPFYMAYVFLGFDVLFSVDLALHLSSNMIWFYLGSSSLMLVAASIFLTKLNYQNITRKWVKKVIELILGERLIKMADFINRMEYAK